MQKLRLISLLLLLAVTVQAQTNLTVLNGTNMPVVTPGVNDFVSFYKWSGVKYQWGRTYIPAFYQEFTNSAAGQTLWNFAANLSTNLATELSTRAAANVALSNNSASEISTRAAANVAFSNNVATELATRGTADTALSNAVALKYDASNPTGYQTAAQVQATANAAAAAATAGTVTSNGAAVFSSVTASNYFVSLANLGNVPGASYTVDLGLAAMQTLIWTNNAAFTLNVTNFAAGQNVTIVLKNNCGVQRAVTLPVVGFKYQGTTLNPNNGESCLILVTSTTNNSTGAHVRAYNSQ